MRACSKIAGLETRTACCGINREPGGRRRGGAGDLAPCYSQRVSCTCCLAGVFALLLFLQHYLSLRSSSRPLRLAMEGVDILDPKVSAVLEQPGRVPCPVRVICLA